MLHDLMQTIRSHLGNYGFHRHGLERFHHANACAAVDVLEDAELAIAGYLGNQSTAEPGLDYLRTYGVLQAAYLQQDAAKLLRKAFGLPSNELPGPMDELRDLRNRATGHPASTPAQKGKPPPPAKPPRKPKPHPPATFIARYAMSSRSLMVLRIEADGTSHSSSVDLRVMLKAHSEALHSWMEELVDELQRQEKERREDIVARGPVSALMHPSWSYMLQKIHEASSHSADETLALLAQPSVPSLLKVLDEVEDGLRERDIHPPHPRDVETARAALNRLAELLPRAAAGEEVQLDIAAFATLAERHLADLANALHEIDKRLQNS